MPIKIKGVSADMLSQYAEIPIAFEVTSVLQIDLINDGFGGIKLREEKRSKVRNKAIVFIGERYGIFWLAEIMVLSGVRVKDIPKAAGTREEIFMRYKLKPK